MENFVSTLAEYLKLPISTMLMIWGLWCLFKDSILNEVKKQTEKDLISLQSECNKEVLESIEEQKANLKKGLNEQSALLEANVLSVIEKQKAELQKDLNKQIADFQVDLARYSFLKEEEINAYKIFYGKLLKTYYKFRNYSLHKNSIKVSEADYSFFELHIKQLNVPEQIKEKVLDAIKNHDENAQDLFERAQVIHLHYMFESAEKDQEEYFLENELFFSDEVCLPILKFQNRLADLNAYYYLARWQSYEMAGALCVSKFGKLMNETEFRKDVDELKKDIEVIKELIKKEIYEH